MKTFQTCYDTYKASVQRLLQKLRIRQYFGILIAVTLLFFLSNPFVQSHTHLKNDPFQVQWQSLLIASVLLLAYRSIYVQPFRLLLSRTMQKPVSFRDVFMLFHLTNITRYLPGRIWGFVRLLLLSKHFGLSKTAVSGSLGLHVGIETGIGTLIGMSVLFSSQTRQTAHSVFDLVSGHTLFFRLTCIGILTGIIILIAIISPRVIRLLKPIREIAVPLLDKSFWKQWVNIGISHVLFWVCQGLAFYLFVRSFAPLPFSYAGALTACFAFAWICGFLSFLTPGGLGVREWLLGLLLANYIPTSEATLVAVLCRVWMLSAEIILFGVAFFLRKKYPIPSYPPEKHSEDPMDNASPIFQEQNPNPVSTQQDPGIH